MASVPRPKRRRGAAEARPTGEARPQRVALYARVSTDDQADRGTIGGQREFLRSFAQLYNLDVAAEYTDDGFSGALPLAQRPDGQRLLEDAENGAFSTIIVYRLDRLGRSLVTLLEAHSSLERLGVTIRSATEPFDTGTAIGKFLFQLLASLAELEKSTITERMTMGRDRVAKLGKWTGGPVPFGYDVGADGCLLPSGRDAAGRAESEVAREIIERIANGSSCVVEARRLNALGVPCVRRWSSGTELVTSGQWFPDRITYMVRNPAYAGAHILHGKNGPVERPTPALVDRATWDRAQAQLVKNRILATRNARRFYLLRGLVRCACGRGYVGQGGGSKVPGADGRYYRCITQTGGSRQYPKCNGKSIPAAAFEQSVWDDCRTWAQNPGKALGEAQCQLRERLGQAPALEGERRQLQQHLAAKDLERERVMTIFRRGRATVDEVEHQLDAIQHEASDITARLNALRAQQELSAIFESQYTDAAALLSSISGRLVSIEDGLGSDDAATRTVAQAEQRKIIETLLAGITIRTEGEGWHRKPIAEIRYVFSAPIAVDTDTRCRFR